MKRTLKASDIERLENTSFAAPVLGIAEGALEDAGAGLQNCLFNTGLPTARNCCTAICSIGITRID